MTPGRLRDVACGTCAAAASLALYVATLQPDFGGPEDTPKFQFVGYVLGVPHPPGYPLYVLLSHAFVASLRVGTIAYRANLFSAMMAAIACALTYAIARLIGAPRWPSLCAALGLATGASFWRSAVFAEVYSLAAVMAGLTIALLLAWGARGSARWLLAAFGAFAFALGNHLTIVGVVPAFAIYTLTRPHRVFTARVVAAGAVLLALGLAQYGLIVVRTQQQAPYLETSASTVRDLVAVVTAERFSNERFAFGPRVLLTDHLPALARLIAREFGALGTAAFLLGLIAGFRSAHPALVLGAAAGMFVMVLNLAGDLKGFITPLMVLLWPFAAVGIDMASRIPEWTPSAAVRRIARITVVAGAALLPIGNFAANHQDADQSGHSEQARFLRALFNQLPEGSGLVAEDYWADMAWRYYTHTGEAGLGRRISRVDFEAASVRRAAQDDQRVFTFAAAATFLSAEGLRFRRAPIQGAALREWLPPLVPASLVVGGTAFSSFPAELAAIGHPAARSPGRPRTFEAFAAVVRRPGEAWRQSDNENVTLTVNAGSLGAPVPPLPGLVSVSSGPDGAHVEVGGRSVARVTTGSVLVVFAPDGALMRVLEFPAGESDQVPFEEAVYELSGESACAPLKADGWTDIGQVLAGGSWVATLHDAGSVTIDTLVVGERDLRSRSAVLLGDGTIETSAAAHEAGQLFTSTLTRPADRRPVFRLALDRRVLGARARVRGPAAQSVTLCALNAPRPLFEPGRTVAELRSDFESEPYFGAGWSDAERTPTGPARHGIDGATLLLPLEAGHSYRASLDLASDQAGDLRVELNGVIVGSCALTAAHTCDLALPTAAVSGGVNRLAFAVQGTHRFMFRGARIVLTTAPAASPR